MKKNNKGFTLAELVIVIAIMGILLTVVGVSINTIFYNKNKSSAKVVYNMIGAAQNMGMSKLDTYVGLNSTEDGVVNCFILTKSTSGNYVVSKSESFNKVDIKVEYNNSASIVVDKTFGILFHIDRATGKFDKVYNCTGVTWPGTSIGSLIAATTTSSHVKVGAGDSLYDIVLSSETGKFYYND